MFGSVLNYVTLSLLGEELEEMAVARGQKCILDHGGATVIPSWGKFILSVESLFFRYQCFNQFYLFIFFNIVFDNVIINVKIIRYFESMVT